MDWEFGLIAPLAFRDGAEGNAHWSYCARGLPDRHGSEQPPRVPAGFGGVLKIEKAIATNTIGRTAAQASVSGLGIQNRYAVSYTHLTLPTTSRV